MVVKFWINWIIESAVFTYVTMGPPLWQARDKKYLRQLRINPLLSEGGRTNTHGSIAKTKKNILYSFFTI